MEFIFELVIEVLVEGSLEVSKNKKINKWIRYPLLIGLILMFSCVIFGIFFLGIYLFKESVIASLILILISIVMLIASIVKFKKTYLEVQEKNK